MMYGKGSKPMMMKSSKGGKSFKPCAGCPTPAKCAKAGVCAMKAKKGK